MRASSIVAVVGRFFTGIVRVVPQTLLPADSEAYPSFYASVSTSSSRL